MFIYRKKPDGLFIVALIIMTREQRKSTVGEQKMVVPRRMCVLSENYFTYYAHHHSAESRAFRSYTTTARARARRVMCLFVNACCLSCSNTARIRCINIVSNLCVSRIAVKIKGKKKKPRNE